MDVIRLRGIRARGRHGANPGERDIDQAFDVDLDLEVDLRPAEGSDDLSDTVDYGMLHADVVRCVADTSFALLERLAREILTVCFRDVRVRSAEVSVAKPELLDGATPSVRLRRRNPAYREQAVT